MEYTRILFISASPSAPPPPHRRAKRICFNSYENGPILSGFEVVIGSGIFYPKNSALETVFFFCAPVKLRFWHLSSFISTSQRFVCDFRKIFPRTLILSSRAADLYALTCEYLFIYLIYLFDFYFLLSNYLLQIFNVWQKNFLVWRRLTKPNVRHQNFLEAAMANILQCSAKMLTRLRTPVCYNIKSTFCSPIYHHFFNY